MSLKSTRAKMVQLEKEYLPTLGKDVKDVTIGDAATVFSAMLLTGAMLLEAVSPAFAEGPFERAEKRPKSLSVPSASVQPIAVYDLNTKNVAGGVTVGINMHPILTSEWGLAIGNDGPEYSGAGGVYGKVRLMVDGIIFGWGAPDIGGGTYQSGFNGNCNCGFSVEAGYSLTQFREATTTRWPVRINPDIRFAGGPMYNRETGRWGFVAHGDILMPICHEKAVIGLTTEVLDFGAGQQPQISTGLIMVFPR